MAPRRSARIVGVMRKETRVTEEDDHVSLEESAVSVRAVAVEKSTTTPPKIVRVVPVEESQKKKTREEKAKEDGVEQTRTQEAAAAAEGEQNEEEMRKKASGTGAAKKVELKGEKKIRKKKMKRKGSGGGGGYRRYVFRVLKQVHPELRVSSMAMAVLNGFMNDMFERIVGEAAQLSKYSGKMTLSAKEIQGAVRLVLPGELGKHAVAEGMKAITNYYSAVIVKPPS